MIRDIQNKNYWFTSSGIITELPKEVKVISSNRHVVVFDTHVLNENYADVEIVRHDLYETEEDCWRAFMNNYRNPDTLVLVLESALKDKKLSNPEYFL